ncbi:MAG: hypothetical protein H3C51_00560 [Rubellimicrobium sp.]|nr:hypothetical protein [Rubellimicrobium sp.]
MHEEQAKRPLDDQELQAVVGGAAGADSPGQVLAGMYELRSKSYPDLVLSFDIDEARQKWANTANTVALHTGLGGLRGLLDAFTDDDGNVDPAMTISLDQVRAGLAGLDGVLEQHNPGTLAPDHSGGISVGDVTAMIAVIENELDASENAWLQGLMMIQEMRLKTSEMDRARIETTRTIAKNI